MQKLELNSTGPFVEIWQNYLLGQKHYSGYVSGVFDSATKEATKKYQEKNKLFKDGIVGDQTWGHALFHGLQLLNIDYNEAEDKHNPNWPPKILNPLSYQERESLFGKFSYRAAALPNNPEAIIILGDWKANNIVSIEIPQLRGVFGAPKSGKILMHKKIAQQTQALFQAWEDAGLKKLILSFAGSFVPRFIRGSKTTLSNHSYGTAFDINAGQNGLGIRPPLVGAKGSVRELVPIANELGFFWGGHYPTRADGMHFEAVKIK